MVVGLLPVSGMVMLVGAVLAGVVVIVDMRVGSMVMLMAMLVVMRVAVGVGVFMAVHLTVVIVFVCVAVVVLVLVFMLMGVFAFHCVVLLSCLGLCYQRPSRSRWI
jgi:hypothetical protein